MSTDPSTQSTTTTGEPLAPVAIVSAVVSAVIALLTAFGLDLSAEQVAAIMGLVAALGALAVWLVGRRKTVPTGNVAAMRARSGQLVAGDAVQTETGTPVRVLNDIDGYAA